MTASQERTVPSYLTCQHCTNVLLYVITNNRLDGWAWDDIFEAINAWHSSGHFKELPVQFGVVVFHWHDLDEDLNCQRCCKTQREITSERSGRGPCYVTVEKYGK